MLRAAALLAVVPALVVATSLPAAADPPAGSPPPDGTLVVRKESVKGSGCAGDTAAVAASPDNQFFTVTYSDFLVRAGAGARSTDTRNCSLRLKVAPVKGYTFAITQVDVRGFASLESGASAAVSLAVSYPSAKGRSVTYTLPAPWGDNWQRSQVTSADFAPCTGAAHNVTVDNALTVDAGTSDPSTTSLVTLDSSDVSSSLVLRVSWRHC